MADQEQQLTGLDHHLRIVRHPVLPCAFEGGALGWRAGGGSWVGGCSGDRGVYPMGECGTPCARSDADVEGYTGEVGTGAIPPDVDERVSTGSNSRAGRHRPSSPGFHVLSC